MIAASVALVAAARLAGLAYVHDGAQSVVTRRDRATGGALDPSLTWRKHRPFLDRALVALSDRAGLRRQLTGTGSGLAVPTAQMVAGAALVIWPQTPALLAGLLILDVIIRARLRFGVDGGDEMLRVVTAVLLLGSLSAADGVHEAAAAFLAVTGCAAYMSPGLLKSSSSSWWTGRALTGLVSTLELGWAPAAHLLGRHPGAAAVLSRTLILWEALFAVGLLAGPSVALVVSASAIMFHAVCALVMGLDGFLLPFAAVLPCVVASADLVSAHVPGPIRLGCGCAVTLGVAARVIRGRRIAPAVP